MKDTLESITSLSETEWSYLLAVVEAERGSSLADGVDAAKSYRDGKTLREIGKAARRRDNGQRGVSPVLIRVRISKLISAINEIAVDWSWQLGPATRRTTGRLRRRLRAISNELDPVCSFTGVKISAILLAAASGAPREHPEIRDGLHRLAGEAAAMPYHVPVSILMQIQHGQFIGSVRREDEM